MPKVPLTFININTQYFFDVNFDFDKRIFNFILCFYTQNNITQIITQIQTMLFA